VAARASDSSEQNAKADRLQFLHRVRFDLHRLWSSKIEIAILMHERAVSISSIKP